MKRVLITRPEPGASQTAAHITSLGLTPVLAPVLSILPREVRSLATMAATLLTSRNAVSACPPSLYDLPVFAVGTATAAQATKAGFKRVFDAEGDAAALVSLVAHTLSPVDGSLLLPTARGQGENLARSLRQRGFRVIHRIAYEVVPVDALPSAAVELLSQHKVDIAMFFSGETSRHFTRLIQTTGLTATLTDVEAVSISEQAAMALRSLPWRRICVAAKPNQDAVLALLQ